MRAIVGMVKTWVPSVRRKQNGKREPGGKVVPLYSFAH